MPVTPKTIIVFCDGTGQDGLITCDQDCAGKRANHFTNVLRLSRAITKTFGEGPNERAQVVVYQSGVGVATNFTGSVGIFHRAQRAFGSAVAGKIRDAYNFISQNYVKGDQICLFGFSRGAYTAFKIACLINRLGLLPPAEMGRFVDYWKQLDGKQKGVPRGAEESIPIKCIGLWDTVASVIDGGQTKLNALMSIDNEIPSNVEMVFHALSFHENRRRFRPTVFGGARGNQVWFPGAHSDVGGGYSDSELADISLAWMVGQCNSFIGIDEAFIKSSLCTKKENLGWGKSKPHNAYQDTGFISRIFIGRESRLSLLEKDCELHPSLLESPATEGLLTPEQLEKRWSKWTRTDHVRELTQFENMCKERWHEPADHKQEPEFEDMDELDALYERLITGRLQSLSTPMRQDDLTERTAERLMSLATPSGIASSETEVVHQSPTV